jgi:hypothetical protein
MTDHPISAYPNFPGKHGLRAFVDPEDTIAYVRAHGDLNGYTELKGVILTYQRSVLEHVFASENLDQATTKRGFRGIVTLPSANHEIGVLGGFGFGAPVATFLLENFIALGTTRFHLDRNRRRPAAWLSGRRVDAVRPCDPGRRGLAPLCAVHEVRRAFRCLDVPARAGAGFCGSLLHQGMLVDNRYPVP